MTRKRGNPTFLCISRQNGPQCGYVGYNESYDAWKNNVPTHVHKDSAGHSEPAWGPESECKFREPVGNEATP